MDAVPTSVICIRQFHNERESAVVTANRFLMYLTKDRVINVFSSGNSICVVYVKDGEQE